MFRGRPTRAEVASNACTCECCGVRPAQAWETHSACSLVGVQAECTGQCATEAQPSAAGTVLDSVSGWLGFRISVLGGGKWPEDEGVSFRLSALGLESTRTNLAEVQAKVQS